MSKLLTFARIELILWECLSIIIITTQHHNNNNDDNDNNNNNIYSFVSLPVSSIFRHI